MVKKSNADGEKMPKQKVEDEESTVPKKRGRKPRGGKLVSRDMIDMDTRQIQTNVILNLRCSLKDLESSESLSNTLSNNLVYVPAIPPSVQSYDTTSIEYSIYDEKKSQNGGIGDNTTHDTNDTEGFINANDNSNECVSNKQINAKLRDLKIQYYKKNVSKKSACFWCTCEFDNPTCYIPMELTDNKIVGYGSFCRPECAVSHLFRENIDDALKFERYHLLNSVYSSVFGYLKNIKPAPDPHYLLEKFYGNLTIQEYRKLLGTEHMLLVLDNPITRHLPELHDDNDQFTNEIFSISSNDTTTRASNSGIGKYKVKRESEKKKGPSKKSLIAEHFGL
jgi:hypothetical protein